MKFYSTRAGTAVDLERAVLAGTAPDGGLYIPERFPPADVAALAEVGAFAELTTRLLMPFFADSSLSEELSLISLESLNFPIPLRRLEAGLSVLELFHGPTAAFKDVGARFLAATLTRMVGTAPGAHAPVTILVATSGDTGGAVAAAFHRKPGIRVVVLFPHERVSPRQQHQLTCWGDNVMALAVRGEFDDCQRLVKEAFSRTDLSQQFGLVSANSINVGRLLPQVAYYAKASLEHYRTTREKANFIIPTGNLGNGLACVWARQMGLPIRQIVFATNANTTIADFLATGQWLPRPSVATLASAMDVGAPSNMERLRHSYGTVEDLREAVSACAVSDDEICNTIRDEYQRHRLAWCPHTATALHVYRQLPQAQRKSHSWIVVATAHAAKFDTIVEPLIGTTLSLPPELAALLARPTHFDTVDGRLEELTRRL